MSMMEMDPGRLGPMNPLGVNPPSMQPASFEAWQALTAPGDVFRHPRQVLAHPHLSRGDKRTILASWASDACAMENAPGLRCLTGTRAEPVPVDEVLAALAQLDREVTAMPPPAMREPRRRLHKLSNLRRFVRPRGRDDDDDPPPCPAAVMPRPRRPSGAAALAIRMPA